jgi:hypothetical protein
LVKEEDRPNTSFTTPWGTFEYLRMAFWLMIVGSTFQHAIHFPPLGKLKLISHFSHSSSNLVRDMLSHYSSWATMFAEQISTIFWALPLHIFNEISYDEQ